MGNIVYHFFPNEPNFVTPCLLEWAILPIQANKESQNIALSSKQGVTKYCPFKQTRSHKILPIQANKESQNIAHSSKQGVTKYCPFKQTRSHKILPIQANKESQNLAHLEKNGKRYGSVPILKW